MSKKLSIAVTFFLLSSLVTIPNNTAADDNIPEWGVYVYMAGDNTLYNELTDDLNEMKMVGSNEDLEIVALTDKINNNDSHAYHILQHNLEERNLDEINNTWENELDMGDGDTLRDFLIWASNEFPAKRKILIIWNHGSGWEKVAEDEDSFLTVPEIRKSIDEYRENTGEPPFALIGFDACLMGMFEIMYELREHAEMIHGSEAYEPLEGWTYNHLLYKLNKNLNNEELAYHVVNDYIESYRNGSVYTSYSVTSAVVATNKLNSLWNELNNFTTEINSVIPIFKNELDEARSNTQRFDQNPNYRDLYDLTLKVEEEVPVISVKEAARELRKKINESILFEDHWKKPEKLNVERAHGMTIYFPPNGPKTGYNELEIKDNQWFDFLTNYNNEVNSQSYFVDINAISTDTGTGYNDSVAINGTYIGNPSILKLRMIDPYGQTIEKLEQNISGGAFSNLFTQPKKSGNYAIEITLYDDEGYLQDYYYQEELFVDLNLPDLHLEKPILLCETSNEIYLTVKHISIDDTCFVEGEVKNLGTVDAENITVIIEYGDEDKIVEHSILNPNNSFNWTLNNNEIFGESQELGEIRINVTVSSSDLFEIDSENNRTTFAFSVYDKSSHAYNSIAKNLNTIELETNPEGEYYFPWLESEITITDNIEQSWDLLNFEFYIPNNWNIEDNPVLHTNEESKFIIRIKPSITSENGENEVTFQIKDRYGFVAGNGSVNINIPQYYGVSIAAQQIDADVKLLVTNTGNGKDTFRITKELDEGLTLYLTETYFELEAFETRQIETQGFQTDEDSKYEAYFSVQSIGNENISADIVLDIKGINKDNENNNLFSTNTIILILGIIALGSFMAYQRRI